jgi:hypothetical protein
MKARAFGREGLLDAARMRRKMANDLSAAAALEPTQHAFDAPRCVYQFSQSCLGPAHSKINTLAATRGAFHVVDSLARGGSPLVDFDNCCRADVTRKKYTCARGDCYKLLGAKWLSECNLHSSRPECMRC